MTKTLLAELRRRHDEAQPNWDFTGDSVKMPTIFSQAADRIEALQSGHPVATETPPPASGRSISPARIVAATTLMLDLYDEVLGVDKASLSFPAQAVRFVAMDRTDRELLRYARALAVKDMNALAPAVLAGD